MTLKPVITKCNKIIFIETCSRIITFEKGKLKKRKGDETMAAGSGKYNKGLTIPEAHKAMDNMKYEIAAEFNLPVQQGSEDYWGNLSARDCGRVGGEITKRLVAMAQNQIINK